MRIQYSANGFIGRSPVVQKAFCLFLTLFNLHLFALAQQSKPTSEIVPPSQVSTIINDSVRKEFKINYHIFRVYKNVDRSGQYYCVLTESNDTIEKDGERMDTINHSIRAINLKLDKDRLVKVWELNDHIVKNENGETSIWFWTRFSGFEDFDNDGIIEPIIIYGTSGMNGYDDGRIKILIYYKGQKIAIRHQNSVLDGGRETKVDDAFYTLPPKLKEFVKAKMALIGKEGKAIFTAAW